MSEIWGVDYFGETRTVDMHIKTLRQKLGESGNKPTGDGENKKTYDMASMAGI